MKNKRYYILFLLYAIMIVFILYINGVFTDETVSITNLLINGGFLLIIGVLFVIAAMSFARLNRCTDALEAAARNIEKEYQQGSGCLWPAYKSRKKVFEEETLDQAFARYQKRMKGYETRRGLVSVCELDEYINEDLLDQVGKSHFNSAISGTLTGLGILGTFLGLSMGLGSFSGDDIYTISDNVGPLLSGMKVAFHTSVYGIFFSLVFTFIYRGIVADAYGRLGEFLSVYRECVMPSAMSVDENSQAMLIYQANMANSMKTMTELLKGNAMEQTKGVERIVDRFTERLSQVMETDFERLGRTLEKAGETQAATSESYLELAGVTRELLTASKTMQMSLEQTLERQEAFSRQIREQGEMLTAACHQMNEELSNQLYTYQQMQGLDGAGSLPGEKGRDDGKGAEEAI